MLSVQLVTIVVSNGAKQLFEKAQQNKGHVFLKLDLDLCLVHHVRRASGDPKWH